MVYSLNLGKTPSLSFKAFWVILSWPQQDQWICTNLICLSNWRKAFVPLKDCWKHKQGRKEFISCFYICCFISHILSGCVGPSLVFKMLLSLFLIEFMSFCEASLLRLHVREKSNTGWGQKDWMSTDLWSFKTQIWTRVQNIEINLFSQYNQWGVYFLLTW